jgi:hypothetical protein
MSPGAKFVRPKVILANQSLAKLRTKKYLAKRGISYKYLNSQ